MELLLLIAAIVAGYFIYYTLTKDQASSFGTTEKPQSPTGGDAPYKVEPAKEEPAQPVTENKVDPVSVALDLEPVAISEPVKTRGRKPKNPLDVNQDGKVNLADAKEAVKKTKAKVKTVSARAKAVTTKASKAVRSKPVRSKKA